MALDADAILAAADLPAIVSARTAIQQRGQEFMALCIFHDDHSPSMSIYRPKGNGHSKWQYKCWSCAAAGDAADFLRETEGLDFKDALQKLQGTTWTARIEPSPAQRAAPAERITSKPPADAGKPNMHIRALGDPVATWEYKDTDGGTLGYVARYEVEGKKEIRQFTWGKRGDVGNFGWGCGHFNKPRPLYALDGLGSRPDSPVLIVEGEKAADAAAQLLPTYCAITWPGGAQAWKHADWEPLRGRKVLLWPDADEPGITCMQRLAAVLSDPKGLACSVRIIDPLLPSQNPDDQIPEGWDAGNAVAEGWTTEQVIAWARPRATDYDAAQQNPAPQVSEQAEVAPPPSPGTSPAVAGPAKEADSEPPSEVIPIEAYAADSRAKASPARKKRPSRPRLASIDGNLAEAEEEDAEPVPAQLSEDALAEHFVRSYGEDWRYCTEWAAWLQWKGDGWHRDRRNEVSDLCKVITRQALEWPEAASLTPASKQKINRKATAWNARDLAAVDRRLTMVPEQLDADPMMLGVPGGLVDLRTGKLLEAQREHYVTRRCCVAPAEGEHPLFDRVLARACAGNDGMREYLLRWFGYMLTGSVAEEAFMFLHGPGGSGKSTLIKVLTEIMGDYATTISMDALTESPHQRHSQEIAKLEGSRLVYASETEEGRRFKESLVKWLTGGDKVVAHRMRMDDREFKPQFKIIIYGNSVPHLKSVGEEMRRRIHLVEYAGSLSAEERDTTLKERLVAEYPAILHTMIRGCVDWQECHGLGKPESVSAAVDQYMEGEDSMAAFFDECVERVQQSKELTGDVYRRYRSWATNAGEYQMSQKRFVQVLRTRGFERMRSGGQRYISGLKLRDGLQAAEYQPNAGDGGYEVP